MNMTVNQEAVVLMLVIGSAWGFVRVLADGASGTAWMIRKFMGKGRVHAWRIDPDDLAPADERDWPVEILTLAADIVDEHGRATFGADEARAIRAVLRRLDQADVCDLLDGIIAAWALEGRDASLLVHTVIEIRRVRAERSATLQQQETTA